MYIRNEKTYHRLRYIAQIVLPAMATFYATLGGVWHLPFREEIPASIMALDTLLGTLLHISTNNYLESNVGEANE